MAIITRFQPKFAPSSGNILSRYHQQMGRQHGAVFGAFIRRRYRRIFISSMVKMAWRLPTAISESVVVINDKMASAISSAHRFHFTSAGRRRKALGGAPAAAFSVAMAHGRFPLCRSCRRMPEAEIILLLRRHDVPQRYFLPAS